MEPWSRMTGAARDVSPVMRWCVIAALCAVLPACGFHLRGKVDLPFDTVFVDGTPYSKLTLQVKRGIEGATQTRLSDTRESAQAIVELLGDSQERIILAVSGGGRVRELQLRYRVTFRVTDPKQREWLPRNDVVILRDMTYDDSQVLAKEAEANQLFREMQADAIQQLLRRIQAIQAASEVDA
jgi:LPS-assembly lipoprotein